MHDLTSTERQLIKEMIGYILENRSSALMDLTNRHRQELYIVFAKMSGALDSAAVADRTTGGKVEAFPGPSRANLG